MMKHEAPPQKDIEENKQFEPEGEALRAALTEFLAKHKIVSMLIDTEGHSVEIQAAELPPKMKNVLSRWGSIYVLDDSPDERDCPQVGVGGRHSDGWFEGAPCAWCAVASPWARPVRPADWDDNVIPPMTHPLSRGWDQPNTALVAIDDTTSAMPNSVFTRLMEYSSTMPSGAYEGKMWKAHVLSKTENFWQLRWYGYSKIGPGHVSNNVRRIVLTDGELPR